MKYELTLPSLGDDAGDEATVSFFYFEEGQEVKEEESIVEMVTDKATFDVPCPKKGTVVEKLVEEDDVVKVGQPIAILDV